MKPPFLKVREMIRILESLGFYEARQKGSQKFFKHRDGRVTTVPFHKGRDLATGIVRQICKDVNMAIEELKRILGE
jgi:predicted RNA binding protein YcfA (HicA-like mRNA interferase family)